MATSGVSLAPRALRPIGWAVAVLFLAALVVQFTHAGIDIFMMFDPGHTLAERILAEQFGF